MNQKCQLCKEKEATEHYCKECVEELESCAEDSAYANCGVHI